MSKLEEIKKQFQYDKKVVKEFKTGTTNYDVLNYIYRLECEIHYLDAKNKNSEQAINEIKEYVNERLREDMPNKRMLEENKIVYGTIKKIIDKVGGNE